MVASIAELTAGALIDGLDPAGSVAVVQTQPVGASSIQLTFRRTDGTLDDQILFGDRLIGIRIVAPGRVRGFDADGRLFKPAAEAARIGLAHLFDPYLAVTTSRIEPLPHQITAVYEEMLPRQPLRFLLADDPGAGKTIMAGLLIKELLIRGDLERCLVVAPGSLVEQWQDELGEKFGLEFDMLTRDRTEIEVKGRSRGAETITLTRNELGLNAQDVSTYILAQVEVADGRAPAPRYVRRPFDCEPDTGAVSLTHSLQPLLARSTSAC